MIATVGVGDAVGVAGGGDAAMMAMTVEVDAGVAGSALPDAEDVNELDLGTAEPVAAADPETEPVQPGDESGTVVPPVPVVAPPARTVKDAMALVKQGRRDEAIAALRVLWKQQPRNANLPFVLGNLYHDKTWWGVAIQYYEAAIARDHKYARNATMIHNLIDMLASAKTRGKAGYVLRKTIGAAARSQLQYAAKHHANPAVRKSAAALLKR